MAVLWFYKSWFGIILILFGDSLMVFKPDSYIKLMIFVCLSFTGY